MQISVIIPALNAASYLPVLLQRLQNQTKQPHEIIVVDSASTDDTVHIAQQHGVTVLGIDRKDFDHGGTRNYAVSQSTGDVLVFLTQDAEPMEDSFLEKLILPLADDEVAAVYGRQVARPDASDLEKLTREFNYPPHPTRKSLRDLPRLGIKTYFMTNVCSAYRRRVFEQMGGFQSPIISNEDMIMAAKIIQAGHTIAYAADAKVLHSHDYTIAQQFRRHFDIGVSICLHRNVVGDVQAEGEGKKLLLLQLKLLAPVRQWHRIPGFCAQTAAKYAGYRLGLIATRLPSKLRLSFSMHKGFWKHYEGN